MADSRSEIGLRQYLEILQRRKWIIIEVFVVLVGTVAVGSLLQTPVYRASAALLVETEAPSFGGRRELPLVASALETTRIQSIETHKRLITRRPVLDAVIKDMDLHVSVEKFRRQVSVVTFRDTDVIEIHFDDQNPAIAADVANSIAENYVLLNREHNRASAASASGFLQQQLVTVKQELSQTDEELEQYKRSKGISDLDQETRQQIKVLGDLSGQLATEEAEAQAAAAQSRVMEEKLSEQERMELRNITETPNPVVEDLQMDLARLEVQRAGLLEEYAPQSSRVRAVDAQIDSLRQQLSQQLTTILASTSQAANPVHDALLTEAARNKAAAVAARERVAALAGAVHQAEVQLGKIPSKQKELAQLVRAQEVGARVYTLLLEKYHEVRVAEAMSLANAYIVEPAVIPEFPIKPRTKLNIALASVFGLVLAIMLASVIEYLDDTIKDPEEVGELLGIPVLGTVPLLGKEESALVVEQSTRSRIAEAFRTIRSNLSFAAVDHPIRSLVITSAIAGEGKSLTAANLGITMAWDNKEVILVDSDLRRPTLHKLFDIDNTVGLSTVLVGERDLDEVLRPTEVEGLRILSSGPIPPNPVELLASDKMAQLCEMLASRADFVLYDSPPAVLVADAATLAARTDGVIIVVEQGGTNRKLIAGARDALVRAHSRIVGAVVNKMSRAAGGYYYYYHYYDYASKEA